MSKKITVITVCFNSQETIRMTIESVLTQKYKNIEYLIIDGASKDDTMRIISEYSDPRMKVISEPDRGLYDAMNKATAIATGEYLSFLNSGDVFADDMVLADMADRLHGDLTYGNVIRIRTDGEVFEGYGECCKVKWLLLKGRMICHQAMFVNREVMMMYGYDLQYKITADFNMLCKLVRDKRKLVYVDRNVVRMDNITGISTESKNLPIMWKEDDMSIRDCFPIWYQLLRPVKYVKRKFF